MIDAGYALAGALTGLLVGLTGVGGGAVMTPLLLLFFNVPPVTAIATDLWFAAITKVFGAAVHQGGGNVDWRVARRLWIGSLPLALVVVLLVSAGVKVHKLDWLTHLVGALVLLTGGGLLLAPRLLTMVAKRARMARPAAARRQAALTIAAGAGLGICVALTSVGAGALGSVLLLCLYPGQMPPHRLVATDIVHAIPLAVIAGCGYLWAGLVDGHMLLSLLAGSVPAVLAGSFLSRYFSARGLQVALAGVLLLAGIKTLG